MSKFIALKQAVSSMFAASSWSAMGINTSVENFTPNFDGEYVSISIIPGRSAGNVHSVAGQLIIDIYIPAGQGTKRLYEIADALDDLLSAKSVSQPTGTLQFFESYLSNAKPDPDNKALYRTSYHINFSFFGVKR